MKSKKMPAPRRAGTRNKRVGNVGGDRRRREAAVVSNLEWLQKNDPARFTKAMQLLASLVVSVRDKKK